MSYLSSQLLSDPRSTAFHHRRVLRYERTDESGICESGGGPDSGSQTLPRANLVHVHHLASAIRQDSSGNHLLVQQVTRTCSFRRSGSAGQEVAFVHRSSATCKLHLPPPCYSPILIFRICQHFRFDNPDKSLDRDPQYSYIPIHRFYLATEICESGTVV